MEDQQLRFGRGFQVVPGNKRSQAAQMTLSPGKTEGGPDNRHKGADQWLFVVAGRGIATVNGRRIALRAGTLVLIEGGDRNEISNTGRTPLRTLNFYVPPAYTGKGEPLDAG